MAAVALVAAREVRERTRGRVFRIGTIVILLAIAAGVVIPTLHHSHDSAERVGVLGVISAPLRSSIVALGPAVGTAVSVVNEPDIATARHALSVGDLDIVLDDTTQVLLNTAPSGGDTSTTARLAEALAVTISLQTSLQASGLSAQQAAALTHPKALTITGLHPAKSRRRGTRSPCTG
jgi:ABC-type Na+ efflux pump permease subunit